VTHASGAALGVQLAGVGAVSGGSSRGLQLGIGGTFTRRSLVGVQMSGAVNWIGDGAFSRGTQLTAGANITRGPLEGLQLAAIGNVATEPMSGMQGAAWINVANSLIGLQAAVVNIGGDVRGAQIGFVNIGRRVRGAQIGVVNIAEEVDGDAVGLLTIAKDTLHPIAWASSVAFMNAGMKFTTKHLYTVVAVGHGTRETDFDGGPLVTVGLGGRIRQSSRFDLEPELGYSTIDIDAKTNQALHARITGGLTLGERLRLFVGGGPRIPIAFEQGSLAVRPELLGGLQY
jgi:hypothetical protein